MKIARSAKATPLSRRKPKQPSLKTAKQHAPKAAFSDLARKPNRPWRLALKRDNGAA